MEQLEIRDKIYYYINGGGEFFYQELYTYYLYLDYYHMLEKTPPPFGIYAEDADKQGDGG